MAILRIWKFDLPVNDEEHDFKLPIGSRLVHVACQDPSVVNVVQLWFEVNPEVPKTTRSFLVLGTGHAFEGDAFSYVGTGICAGGRLVWHVLEQER